jgi:hypothetical protein
LKELKNGIIGSNLKMLLATKTIVFCGFSLKDFDFNEIYKYIHSELGSSLPSAYFISLSGTNDEAEKFNLSIIKSEATQFFRSIRNRLVSQKMLLNPSVYTHIMYIHEIVHHEHMMTSDYFQKAKFEYKARIAFCLSYQDGILDSFSRLFDRQNTGEYLIPQYMMEIVDKYEKLVTEYKKKKQYKDVAYFAGYSIGLKMIFMFGMQDDSVIFPIFYILGYNGDIMSFDKFKKITRTGSFHKTAEKQISDMIGSLGNESILHHIPYL